MTIQSPNHCFTSDLFEVEPGEDEQTNPHRYGKRLSHWLAEKLFDNGYPNVEVIPEDWGWCVMCSRQPFLLWIGCGNSESIETIENPEPLETQEIVWQCFVVTEVPFWKRIFGRPETKTSENELDKKLLALLSSEPRIRMVECP